MPNELKRLLLMMAVGALSGLVVGIALRKFFPEWCKRYAKFCRNRPWKFLGFGVVFFGAMAVFMFLVGMPYFGGFFVIFCLFELYCFFAYGFKRLTPEQERQIDESKPRKLRPFRFWKAEKE